VRTGREVEGVTDSKKLSQKKRLELFAELQRESLYYVVPATPNSISEVNIYIARNIAVYCAVRGLLSLLSFRVGERVEKVLLDGKWSKSWLSALGEKLDIPFEGVVNGDDTVYEMSAASVVAKCYCDALFAGWEQLYPDWAVNCHHGALTRGDKEVLRTRGPSPLHRVGVYGRGWWRAIFSYDLKRDKREKG